jgi:hypothetical protein
MTALVTAALLTALTGCGDDPDRGDVDPLVLVLGDRVEILPPNGPTNAATGAWRTPELGEVVIAGGLLEEHFPAEQRRHPDLTEWDSYFVQYAGLEDGSLAVNAFCEEPAGWRTTWVSVQDGGACYWQATVADGEVTSFTVNGEG